jgi:ribosomal protein S27AE
MAKTNPMLCPDCGLPMNHHADKVDYTAAEKEGAVVDPQAGGVVAEFHTCPECGKTHSRVAAERSDQQHEEREVEVRRSA